MKDEAVSPVIAFMLLLMVVVSFISLLNAYYIPSLKEQAEVEHLGEVHRSFLQIGSDLNRVLTFQQDGVLREQIELGGGDVIFSPIRSSGTVQISGDGWIAGLEVTNSSGYTYRYNCSLASFAYHPVGNFWINQGYRWRAGVLNVSKGGKTTWAEYITADEAELARYSFVSLLSIPGSEETPSPSNATHLEGCRIVFRNMSYDPQAAFISSNGMIGLNIRQNIYPERIGNVTTISWSLNTGDPSYARLKTRYDEWFAEQFNFKNCVKSGDLSAGVFSVTFVPDPIELTLVRSVITARLA
jgi:hypothetical protein